MEEQEISRSSILYKVILFLIISIPIYLFVSVFAFIPQYIFAFILYLQYKISSDDKNNMKDKKLVYALSLLMIFQSLMLFFAFLIGEKLVWGLLVLDLFICGVSFLLILGISGTRSRVKKMSPIMKLLDGPIFGTVDTFMLFVFYLFSSLIFATALIQVLFNSA